MKLIMTKRLRDAITDYQQLMGNGGKAFVAGDYVNFFSAEFLFRLFVWFVFGSKNRLQASLRISESETGVIQYFHNSNYR